LPLDNDFYMLVLRDKKWEMGMVFILFMDAGININWMNFREIL
jgi:hypothetical protein